MQIERGILGVETLGPGNRFVFWVNGCSRRCNGCVSKRLQEPCPEHECDVVEFIKGFDLSGVDGVTISGGEPFDQLTELARAVEYLSSLKISDILVYTGYKKEELEVLCDKRIDKIFNGIGVLIDGAYVKELDFGQDNLRGSLNQRIHFLNASLKEKYKAYHKSGRVMQEFWLGEYVVGVGIPTAQYIKDFEDSKG